MIQPSLRDFVASDGYRIQFLHWQAQEPRGIVIPLHGIQSHSGWYEASSRAMADAGFDVYFADRRGSGLNGFQRGHAPHGMRLINDVRGLAALARHERRCSDGQGGALPVTLMGISWGGKTAAAMAGLFPQEVTGLTLLYPGLEPRIRPNAWQRFQLGLARRLEITKTDIPVPLRAPELFTDSMAGRQFIAEDPLALHTVTSGLLNAGRDLDAILASHASDIACPTLLMLAECDRIVDNARTRRRISEFGTVHLTSICCPRACHTLEFEPDRDTIFAELTEWLRRHATGSPRQDCR